jgi:hypothetical protein
VIDARVGRDVVDAGADVVITSDATTIAYAAAQAHLSSVPLSWDRLYILIEPGPPSRGQGDSALAVKTDLATDALRVEARSYPDSTWRVSMTCPTIAPMGQASGAAPRPSTMARIVYDNRDDVARALSERLVALAQARAPRLAALEGALSAAGAARAVGLDSGAFRESLADGREAAYVVAVPAEPIEQCFAADWIRLHTPWLATVDYPVGDHITPLIETRARAIVRSQRVGLSIDGAGNVYLEFGPRPRP